MADMSDDRLPAPANDGAVSPMKPVAAACRRAEARRTAGVADVLLGVHGRLDDRTRTAASPPPTGAWCRSRGMWPLRPARLEVAFDVAVTDVPARLAAVGLLRDPDNVCEAIAQARIEAIDAGLARTRPPSAATGLVSRLADAGDRDVRDRATDDLVADNRRRQAGANGPTRCTAGWPGGARRRCARPMESGTRHSRRRWRSRWRTDAWRAMSPGAALRLAQGSMRGLASASLSCSIRCTRGGWNCSSRCSRRRWGSMATRFNCRDARSGGRCPVAGASRRRDRARRDCAYRLGIVRGRSRARRRAAARWHRGARLRRPEAAGRELAMLTLDGDFRGAIRALDGAAA
ncbi:hypothetical protein AB5I41_17775 [Sphingomonas sp. MMS24-JH45]